MIETYEYVVYFRVGNEAKFRYYMAENKYAACQLAHDEFPGCVVYEIEFTGNSIRHLP